MIASAVLIHVVMRLSDVPSRGKWSKCSLPLPVVLLVCSFNVLIFSIVDALPILLYMPVVIILPGRSVMYLPTE